MPELPDLEVVKEFLGCALEGAVVSQVEVRRPIVVRDLVGDGSGEVLIGQAVSQVGRLGKFLWFGFTPDLWVAVNPKLAGRLAWRNLDETPPRHTVAVISFTSGRALDYRDPIDMGQVYITPTLEEVPGFAGQGPDALDPALTQQAFEERLRPFRGEIKGVLVRQELVAGIGNAYADEILFRAGISPFCKRSQLGRDEVARLYGAMGAVLREAIEILRQRVGDRIEVEVRDFLQIHGRGGLPCPRCGSSISELRARQRITSFCRTCQPGTLVRN